MRARHASASADAAACSCAWPLHLRCLRICCAHLRSSLASSSVPSLMAEMRWPAAASARSGPSNTGVAPGYTPCAGWLAQGAGPHTAQLWSYVHVWTRKHDGPRTQGAAPLNGLHAPRGTAWDEALKAHTQVAAAAAPGGARATLPPTFAPRSRAHRLHPQTSEAGFPPDSRPYYFRRVCTPSMTEARAGSHAPVLLLHTNCSLLAQQLCC